MNKNIKIAIIGAGPSGLSAAEALREKGYTNITIFEKRAHAGGQSLSGVYKTQTGKEITYDLGSAQPTGSKHLFRLIKENNLHLGKELSAEKPAKIRLYSVKNKKYLYDSLNYTFGFPPKELPALLIESVKLSYYLWRYRRLSQPGFGNFNDNHECPLPFDQWIEKINLPYLGRVLNCVIGGFHTGGNYQFRNDLSCARGLKTIYQFIKFPMRYINGNFVPVTEGYQAIWQKVSAKYEVIYNATISKIIRNVSGIKIIANEKEYDFDKLIIACQPDQIINALDATPSETEIANKILHAPVWRALFVGKNLPHDALYGFSDAYEYPDVAPTLGLIIPEGKISENEWLYSSVLACGDESGVEEAKINAEKLLSNLFNGEVVSWEKQVFWKTYATTFTNEDVKKGILDQFEKMQGLNNTYYTGETMSGGLHATVVDYSFNLITKHFG